MSAAGSITAGRGGIEAGRAAVASALQRTAAGDRDAFEELYRRTSAKLFGVCLRLMPTRAEAEDVLQDVYLTVWRHAASFDRTRGSAMTWLLTVTRNRAVDHLRRGNAAAGAIDIAAIADPVDPAADQEALVVASDEERQLADCLERLAHGDAGLIRTAFFHGSTYSDLARRTTVPLGTIKSRIRRALLQLRECLQ